jgi:hypothetical protein
MRLRNGDWNSHENCPNWGLYRGKWACRTLLTQILFEEIRHLPHKKFVCICKAQTLCPISVWGDEALSVQSSSLSVMLKTYTHGASSLLIEILTSAVGPPHEKPTLLLCFQVQFQRFFPSPDLYSHKLTRGLAHKGEDTNVAVGSPWPIPPPPVPSKVAGCPCI